MKNKISSLSQSEDFKNLLNGRKISNPYSTIFFKKISSKNNRYLNVGFVTKKKIGNAVKRNKIKRKLKAAVRKTLTENQCINLNYTYVIFGRNNVYKDKFQLIYNEINDTFKKINEMKT